MFFLASNFFLKYLVLSTLSGEVAICRKKINECFACFKLSTSQVPINLPLSYMGYGAVVPDGYGISYNLQDNNIIYAICSFFSCQSTNSRRFCEALALSLRDMKELFTEE